MLINTHFRLETKSEIMEIKKLLLILVCVLAFKSHAQSYTFTATTATYTNLTGSTSLNGTATWDDPDYTIPIGFNFQYFGDVLNNIYISNIGYGGDLADVPNYTGVVAILRAYGADIIDRGYDFAVDEAPTGSLSNISYKLEGAAGNRILKIEWNNVGFYSDVSQNGASATNATNFQLWLFETDNSIELHFGPNTITNTSLVFEGYPGSSVALLESVDLNSQTIGANGALVLTGDPINPTFSTVTTVSEFESSTLNGVIPNGTVYRFTVSGLSIDEFETAALKLFPNPSNDFITISGLEQQEDYTIYNVMGREITQGSIDSNTLLNIENFSNGLYFIEFRNGITLKFIKN